VANAVLPLGARLRDRAAAFNDAGLRYGVADLLIEAAEHIEFIELQEAGLREDVGNLENEKAAAFDEGANAMSVKALARAGKDGMIDQHVLLKLPLNPHRIYTAQKVG
jgi:hypothetical protein